MTCPKIKYDLSNERVATIILPKGAIVSLNGGIVQLQEEAELRVTFPEAFKGQDVMASDVFKVLAGPNPCASEARGPDTEEA